MTMRAQMTVSQFEQIAVAEFVRQVGNEHGWGLQFEHVPQTDRWGIVIIPPRQKEVALLFLVDRATPELTRKGIALAVKHCREQKINYN
jgi:hypothetical protein